MTYLSVNNYQRIQVFIKTRSEETITLDLKTDSTIRELFAAIKEKVTLPEDGDKIRLVFSGKTILNNQSMDNIRLDVFGIKKESTLFEMEDLKGGDVQLPIGSISFIFNPLRENHVKLVPFSDDAPFYCKVIQGLNLLGKCVSEACEAYHKGVWIQLGLGEAFSMGKVKHNVNCPACHQKVKDITNLGFWDCTYTIEGYNEDDGQVKWTAKAPGSELTTFDQGKTTSWSYLEITTKR